MRSALFDGTRNHLVDDMEVISPGPGQVLVRVEASGLCQSDLSVMRGTIPFPTPVVLGHEGAGVVEEIGPGVNDLEVGDHVVLSTLANCGRCAACAAGTPTMCRASWGSAGTPFTWRGQRVHNFAALSTFSERVVVDAGQATTIAKDVPFTAACLIGCAVLTGAGAVFNRAQVQPGERVIVIGAGGIGLNVLQAARIAGASTIVAVDANPEKESQARLFGATHFVLASPESSDLARALTGGGADHVFDCVGSPRTVLDGLSMLDWGGQLVVLGVPAPGTEYPVPAAQLYLDRSILGCRYGRSRPAADIPKYVEMYRRGQLLLDELVTRTYAFDEFDSLIDDAQSARLDRGVLLPGA